MNQSRNLLILKTLIVLSAISSNIAQADVYVDLAQTDEISISNTQSDQHYTLKIEEPALPQAAMLIVPNGKNKGNSPYNSHLPFNSEVIIAANETAIEPAFIHAVITVESRHNPRAQSKKGAYGLMQLMPETSLRFKVLDRNDPKQNVLAGAKYLRELLNLFNGDLRLTLAAYNAGPAAVHKYGGRIPPYRETMDYVPKVLKYYRQYS
jgi:soluble lytic murein transglycosylase-like protein